MRGSQAPVGLTLPLVPGGLVFRHDPKRRARLGLFRAHRLGRHEVAGGIRFFEAPADDEFRHGADMGVMGREGKGARLGEDHGRPYFYVLAVASRQLHFWRS